MIHRRYTDVPGRHHRRDELVGQGVDDSLFSGPHTGDQARPGPAPCTWPVKLNRPHEGKGEGLHLGFGLGLVVAEHPDVVAVSEQEPQTDVLSHRR